MTVTILVYQPAGFKVHVAYVISTSAATTSSFMITDSCLVAFLNLNVIVQRQKDNVMNLVLRCTSGVPPHDGIKYTCRNN